MKWGGEEGEDVYYKGRFQINKKKNKRKRNEVDEEVDEEEEKEEQEDGNNEK